MMALPNSARASENDYLTEEEHSPVRHEFVDGHIFMMAGASETHTDITESLRFLLYGALRGGPCRTYGGDTRVHVAATGGYFYPDLSIACSPITFLPDTQPATLLNPVLIVEVLSPSTEKYDRTTKYENYIQLPSLHSYLLVAQDQPRMELLSRDANWQPHIAQGITASIQLPSLGVTLALDEVYERVAF